MSSQQDPTSDLALRLGGLAMALDGLTIRLDYDGEAWTVVLDKQLGHYRPRVGRGRWPQEAFEHALREATR